MTGIARQIDAMTEEACAVPANVGPIVRVRSEVEMRRLGKRGWVFVTGLVLTLQGGCAVQYYEPDTQTEHLWGMGHFRMKVQAPQENVQATVKGAEVFGASLRLGRDDSDLVLGWNKTTRLEVVSEGASVRLEWPRSDPFSVRVGSRPPFMLESERSEPGHTSEAEGRSE